MFGIGSTELVIILIVALVLIGPSKLPDLMKSVGKGLSEFRRMSTDVKSTLEREIEKADEAKRIEETKKELFGDDAPTPAEAVADAAKTEPAAPVADAAAADAAAASVKPDAVSAPVTAEAAVASGKPASEPKPAAAPASDKSHA